MTGNNSTIEQTTYNYSTNGNLTYSETRNGSAAIIGTTYKTYDDSNRMTNAEGIDGNNHTLYEQENIYTADGKRISRTDDGDETHFYYQGDVLLYTTDDNDDKLCQNIIGPENNIIATIHYDNGQHAYFYNKDIRTSVTNIVDESGSGVVSYRYDDYGNTTKYGNTGFYNEICYTSGVYDETTGLYYLNARYYNPDDQTFTTQDTYRGEQDDPISLNMYAYCGGNPINYVDPSGHAKEWISNKKGDVYKSYPSELRVCTDGKVSKTMRATSYYGDKNHGKSNTTSCFGKRVGADIVPYIVVPPSLKSYKFSVGVIVNRHNGNYLYCVVADVGPQMPLGEVSILAAWVMKGINVPDVESGKAGKKQLIGNQSQSGSWKIIMFEKSAPKSKGKKYGWPYRNQRKLNRKIVKQGKKCYKGKGKCLNKKWR